MTTFFVFVSGVGMKSRLRGAGIFRNPSENPANQSRVQFGGDLFLANRVYAPVSEKQKNKNKNAALCGVAARSGPVIKPAKHRPALKEISSFPKDLRAVHIFRRTRLVER